MQPDFKKTLVYDSPKGERKELKCIVAIIQDAQTKDVLMQGFMDQEAWDKTQETKVAHFWSTSRDVLWRKGATSGNELEVVWQLLDCDCDAVLIGVNVRGDGVVCHTKERSCFFNDVYFEGSDCPRCKTGKLIRVAHHGDLLWSCPKCAWRVLVR